MSNINWKTKAMIVGTVVGALIGLGAATLFTRNADKSGSGEAPEVSTAEALGLAISIIGIVRGIASLADGKSSKKKK
ncbi:MAG: hypothetical protein HND44_22955 [Chloroflexi bacterium]|nr:hypothetical protein [Ardenticatenaceae bacterium]MBL1131301.1 hypothetical protein [Chloroflexota bacterium]NOG37402.1 hypothetical protein [Chloroflexota bacterium]GIK55246.1 MAG: hypothetical protein BroJett015_09090 [Chloroflexota bacterium]